MRRSDLLFITSFLFIAPRVHAEPAYDDWPDITGPYVGQQPPGMTAEMFAPGDVFIAPGEGDIFWVDAGIIDTLRRQSGGR